MTTRSMQTDLFGPRATTRHSDPDTAHEAAAHVNAASVSDACEAVHHAMRLLGPASDELLQRFYDLVREGNGWPPQRCVRKRRKDLCDMDPPRARWTGRKVPNEVGLNVREWEAI